MEIKKQNEKTDLDLRGLSTLETIHTHDTACKQSQINSRVYAKQTSAESSNQCEWKASGRTLAGNIV